MKHIVLTEWAQVKNEYTLDLTEKYCNSIKEYVVKGMAIQEEIDNLPDFTPDFIGDIIKNWYGDREEITIHIKGCSDRIYEEDLYEYIYDAVREDCWDCDCETVDCDCEETDIDVCEW